MGKVKEVFLKVESNLYKLVDFSDEVKYLNRNLLRVGLVVFLVGLILGSLKLPSYYKNNPFLVVVLGRIVINLILFAGLMSSLNLLAVLLSVVVEVNLLFAFFIFALYFAFLTISYFFGYYLAIDGIFFLVVLSLVLSFLLRTKIILPSSLYKNNGDN